MLIASLSDFLWHQAGAVSKSDFIRVHFLDTSFYMDSGFILTVYVNSQIGVNVFIFLAVLQSASIYSLIFSLCNEVNSADRRTEDLDTL